MSKPSKAFVATTFDLDGFRAKFFDNKCPVGVTGCVGQREKCPETGREHIQFYFKTAAAHRITGAKNVLGFEAHIEPRAGTHEQAYDYCTKDDTRVSMFETFGDMKRGTTQGARCDSDCYKCDGSYTIMITGSPL